MSRKERERLTVLAGVKRQELTLVQGAEPMGFGVSADQAGLAAVSDRG